MERMRTQIGIVGAGPAGLMLSHLLHLTGIESIIVEDRSRAYCEARVRAGLMEHWVSELLVETGVGERMKRESMVHDGIHIAFNGEAHPINFSRLVDKHVVIYDQKEVVTDLIARRLADGGEIHFEVEDTTVHDFTSDRPKIRFRSSGEAKEIECDFIAGCDGFHGITRPSIPANALTGFDRIYPFGWLGILAQSPPPEKELIYAYHPRGFALYSMRGPDLSRLYIQCAPDEDIHNWPDSRIWEELHTRLGGVRKLPEGEILQKGITPMRSYVTEPMRYGRLFLAGDAAHIVPPTGAKGMNLAMADVRRLSEAFARFYRSHASELLDAYSDTCLRRVWKAQRFSWWMTQMLHLDPTHSAFDRRRQMAEIDYVTSSETGARSLAENYVGLPFD
jgi:p-hydroxybenzoate 3-monooxygenase